MADHDPQSYVIELSFTLFKGTFAINHRVTAGSCFLSVLRSRIWSFTVNIVRCFANLGLPINVTSNTLNIINNFIVNILDWR